MTDNKEELWCCHVRGPDDVIACADWWIAAELAHMINEHVRKPYLKKPSEFWPRVWASPEPWPHSPDSHAESLANETSEYASARRIATELLEQARSVYEALGTGK